MALTDVKLGTAIESVEATVAYGSLRFRVVVLEEALHLLATVSSSQEDLLKSFLEHAAVIEVKAVKAFRAKGKSPVILFAGDFAPGS